MTSFTVFSAVWLSAPDAYIVLSLVRYFYVSRSLLLPVARPIGRHTRAEHISWVNQASNANIQSEATLLTFSYRRHDSNLSTSRLLQSGSNQMQSIYTVGVVFTCWLTFLARCCAKHFAPNNLELPRTLQGKSRKYTYSIVPTCQSNVIDISIDGKIIWLNQSNATVVVCLGSRIEHCHSLFNRRQPICSE